MYECNGCQTENVSYAYDSDNRLLTKMTDSQQS